MQEVKIIGGKKLCSKCKRNLPVGCFNKATTKSSLSSACKECYNKQQGLYRIQNREKTRERNKTFYRKNKRKVISHQLERLYGITLAEYDRMFEKQNGVCAICNLPEIMRRLSIDHNHKTGTVRELLCTSCNALLGYLREDEQKLENVKRYLQRHAEKWHQTQQK